MATEPPSYRGTLLIEKRPPWDPTVGLCLGPYGAPREFGAFLLARYLCTHTTTRTPHEHEPWVE